PPVKVVSRRSWHNLKSQPSCPKQPACKERWDTSIRDHGVHGRPALDSIDDTDLSDSATAALKCEKAKKYKNEDLSGLPHTMKRWKAFLVPQFQDYMATLDNPWEIADTITYAQKLWDANIPKIKHMVRYKNDPLKQHIYNWQSGFAAWAEKAVAMFFDRYPVFDEFKDHATYVEWTVPKPTEEVDDHSCAVLVPPLDYPYMWDEYEDKDPNNLVRKGAFMHECILDTFAFYLETIAHLLASQRCSSYGRWPHAALALATVAVERAFGQWSTGFFLPLPKGECKFSNKFWGYATNEVMESVDQISKKKWEKICEAAKEYVGAHGAKQSKGALCARSGAHSSGRALVYESDTE
ncbi:hypothetical protein PAXRUDRAFT_178187, partial [Paxillus rubicundulus Ve08.2h10]